MARWVGRRIRLCRYRNSRVSPLLGHGGALAGTAMFPISVKALSVIPVGLGSLIRGPNLCLESYADTGAVVHYGHARFDSALDPDVDLLF